MSKEITLKAVQADGMYYPPEWRPEMGDLDKFRGGHTLRDKAKKIGQGILDVRIELPFPIWCLGCEGKFAMGVRYTAEKFMVGKYLSTPIYKFKFKCHTCPQMMEMRTDPQNFQYVVVSGCRRDVRTWNMEENEQVSFTDSAERARLDSDPMYALEKGQRDKNVLKDRKPTLSKIKIENAVRHGDNFELNRQLRAGLRYVKSLDGQPTEEERQMAKVIATTRVKQAAMKGRSDQLNGVKRTLTMSKLGIQKKKSREDGPTNTLTAKTAPLCNYSDSSEDES